MHILYFTFACVYILLLLAFNYLGVAGVGIIIVINNNNDDVYCTYYYG